MSSASCNGSRFSAVGSDTPETFWRFETAMPIHDGSSSWMAMSFAQVHSRVSFEPTNTARVVVTVTDPVSTTVGFSSPMTKVPLVWPTR
jgi:hypothetical protein